MLVSSEVFGMFGAMPCAGAAGMAATPGSATTGWAFRNDAVTTGERSRDDLISRGVVAGAIVGITGVILARA